MNVFYLDTVIRVSELWHGLLAIAGVAVLVALTLVLVKVFQILNRLGGLIDAVCDPLADTVKRLPHTMDQANAIIGNVVDITDDVAEATRPLMAHVTDVTGSVKTLLVQIGTTLSQVLLALNRFLGVFDPKVREARRAQNSSISQVTKAAGSAYSAYRALKKAGLLGRK